MVPETRRSDCCNGSPGGAGHGLCVGVDGEVVSGEAPWDERLGVDGLDGGVVAGGRERVERLARRVGRVGQHQPVVEVTVPEIGTLRNPIRDEIPRI